MNNRGEPLPPAEAQKEIDQAKSSYKSFVEEWKKKELKSPDEILK